MNKIKQLKEICKQQAHSIRTWNREWREHQKAGKSWQDWKPSVPYASSVDARYYHIAYCTLRGTPYERIEPKVNPGNEPCWEKIKKITDTYKEVPDEQTLCAVTA